jgi:hypothetical protein
MTKIGGAAAALVLLTLGVVGQAAAGDSQGNWFQIGLATGETNGYRWSTGAKGPKHRPLNRICAEISMAGPPRNNGVSEGQDAADCGELRMASDSVISIESLGPRKTGTTVAAAIFRPLVQKVTIVFANGTRTISPTQSPDSVGRGIPSFRYVVASFKAGKCMDRIAAFDRNGKVVSNRVIPPC